MAAVDFRAVTTLRIRHDVTLAAGSTAQLRTATPLGDVFVAITPPDQPGAGMLADGDTIPIDQTGAAATVESVLSSAAILVNGGAVHNLTNVVNGTGRAAGQDGQAFGRMIGKSNELLGKLNARSGQLDAAMTETAQLARALDGKSTELGQVLHAAAPATATLQENAGQISDLVLLLGDTARELGKFPSIAGTDTSGRSVVADANAISRSWNDVVLDPETSLLSLNRLYAPFIKITAGSAISGRAGIDRLVLGAIPDAGFGETRASTAPSGTTGPSSSGPSSTRCGGYKNASSGRGPRRRASVCKAPPDEPRLGQRPVSRSPADGFSHLPVGGRAARAALGVELSADHPTRRIRRTAAQPGCDAARGTDRFGRLIDLHRYRCQRGRERRRRCAGARVRGGAGFGAVAGRRAVPRLLGGIGHRSVPDRG